MITSAYTYTASCSVICHVGATPVLCDVAPGSYEMDYDALPDLVTERTRAVIPVDIAGRMVDYDRLFAALDRRATRGSPRRSCRARRRVIVLADARPLVRRDISGTSLRDRWPTSPPSRFTP